MSHVRKIAKSNATLYELGCIQKTIADALAWYGTLIKEIKVVKDYEINTNYNRYVVNALNKIQVNLQNDMELLNNSVRQNFDRLTRIENNRLKAALEEKKEYIRKQAERKNNNLAVINKKLADSIKYHPTSLTELRVLVDSRVDLIEIDTSKITDMSYLFYKSKRANYAGIEYWNVSNVTNMAYMFAHSNFNRTVRMWKVNSVVNTEGMFAYSKFSRDISNWNLKDVHTKDMFLNTKIKPKFLPKGVDNDIHA